MASPVNRPLNGWKEIASYLGKSVRAVQRWEVTLDLPVRRINTPNGHIVYAETEEIDRWRASLDTRARPAAVHAMDLESTLGPAGSGVDSGARAGAQGPNRLMLAAAGLFLFVAGSFLGALQPDPPVPPSGFRLVDRALEALDADGRVLWDYQFHRSVSQIVQRGERLDFPSVDMDGDGTPEILAFVRFAPPGRPATISDSVYCFGRDGTFKWRVTPDQALRFNEATYESPWVVEDLAVSEDAGPRRLWLALRHHTWWPSFVLEIDHQGTPSVRYVQSGRIFSVASWMTSAGSVLAVGGVSHENESIVALLADGGPSAAFPGRVAGPFGCVNCPENRPDRVFVFARSELSDLFPQRHAFVNNLTVAGRELRVGLSEGATLDGTHSVAVFGPDQTLRAASFADAYWRVHRQLSQAGQVDHDVEHCPELRRARIVREWTEARGWLDRAVKPDG